MNALAVVAVAGAVAGLVVVVLERGDFEHYSILTFGEFRRVRRSSVAEPGHACLYCETTIETGERRDWRKEVVAFGVPIYTREGGTHRYCEDHADPAVKASLVPVGRGGRQPGIRDTLGELDDVVTSVDDATQLVSVMLVVGVAAVMMHAIDGAMPGGESDE